MATETPSADTMGAASPPIPRSARAHYLGGPARATGRRSARYSRFVGMMKFLLPAVAGILVVLVAMWPHLQSSDSRFRIGFMALKAREAEDPSMINARYIGTDNENRPFSVTADLARNLVKGTASVELEMPKADLTLEDGTWLVLTAETGVYTRGTNSLDLVGAVNLFHDSGYEIHTAKAHIDLAQGAAASDDPVSGHGPFGSLEAEGFRLQEKGKVINFLGKSKLVLYPGGEPGS